MARSLRIEYLGAKLDRRELAGVKEVQTKPGIVEQIVRRVSQEFGVEEERLYRRRRPPQARSEMMELCRLYLIKKMSLTEIGWKIGLIYFGPKSLLSKTV